MLKVRTTVHGTPMEKRLYLAALYLVNVDLVRDDFDLLGRGHASKLVRRQLFGLDSNDGRLELEVRHVFKGFGHEVDRACRAGLLGADLEDSSAEWLDCIDRRVKI